MGPSLNALPQFFYAARPVSALLAVEWLQGEKLRVTELWSLLSAYFICLLFTETKLGHVDYLQRVCLLQSSPRTQANCYRL